MSACGGPARYEIRVAGVLDGRWAAWFDGLQISGQGEETVICGLVADQPALVPDPASAAAYPGLLRDLRLKGGRDDYTHTTVQVLDQPGWPTCTTTPGAMRWSASLAGPAAPSGSGPEQCARARESRRRKTSVGEP